MALFAAVLSSLVIGTELNPSDAWFGNIDQKEVEAVPGREKTPGRSVTVVRTTRYDHVERQAAPPAPLAMRGGY